MVSMSVFLPLILGSYLYLYIWEKINSVFHYIWENIHKTGKNKAIFGLGMPPVTGGKTGQMKTLNVFAKSDEIPSLPVQVIKEPEAHGPQRSPECTAMQDIFSQNTVNVACKKN